MYRALVKLILMFMISFSMNGQNSETLKTKTILKKYDVRNYPEGLYYEKEDLYMKIPNQVIKLERRTAYMNRKVHKDSIINEVNFISIDKKKGKIRNVFAISFENNLYFSSKSIEKLAKYGNTNQVPENPNSFYRVIKDGKFFYLEGQLSNVAANTANIILAGAALGTLVNSATANSKGVVFENGGFDILKNCIYFNKFLIEKKAIDSVDCMKFEYNIVKVRALIDKIIK